jgi:endonuclease YncB( thermonuclease family)
VAGRVVEVDAIDTDRYGRTVGLVSINGKILNEELLRNGYAWQYKQYCKKSFCSDWLALEQAASRSQIGLFADPYATPPWEWRKNKR